MIEAGAKEVPEEKVLEAIFYGHEMNSQIVDFINQIVAECGKPKHAYEEHVVPEKVMNALMQVISQERMEELAREYFALEDFFCDDPTVYDELHGVYQYEERPEPRMCVTETVSGANGEIRVVVEGYEDPLCLFPTRKLECNLTKAG